MYELLIAEDDPVQRGTLCGILHRNFDGVFRIAEAENGAQAWQLFQQLRPELALLDINMPGLNGLEVAHRIRQCEGSTPCALLFLTAAEDFFYAHQALRLHALDYLLKPCSEDDVAAALNSAVLFVERQHRLNALEQFAPGAADESAPGAAAPCDTRTALLRDDIRAYIEKNYSRDLSMQEAAQAMNYSTAYFSRLFRQCFRASFSAYLNEFRVGKARQLLVQAHANVREVGLACGYADPDYFTRVFKRITGVTPSVYRLLARAPQRTAHGPSAEAPKR